MLLVSGGLWLGAVMIAGVIDGLLFLNIELYFSLEQVANDVNRK